MEKQRDGLATQRLKLEAVNFQGCTTTHTMPCSIANWLAVNHLLSDALDNSSPGQQQQQQQNDDNNNNNIINKATTVAVL